MEHFKKSHKDYEIFRGGLAGSIHGMMFKVELCIQDKKVKSCPECRFFEECKKLNDIKVYTEVYEKRYKHKLPAQKTTIIKTK